MVSSRRSSGKEKDLTISIVTEHSIDLHLGFTDRTCLKRDYASGVGGSSIASLMIQGTKREGSAREGCSSAELIPNVLHAVGLSVRNSGASSTVAAPCRRVARWGLQSPAADTIRRAPDVVGPARGPGAVVGRAEYRGESGEAKRKRRGIDGSAAILFREFFSFLLTDFQP